jgi:hypothetical protein
MSSSTKTNIIRTVFLLPVLACVGVSGTMNVLFSETLGTDDTTRIGWIVLGLAAAAIGALGLELVRQAWKRGSYAKAITAFLVWLPAVTYDTLIAYGFTNREQVATMQRQLDEARPRAKAEARVQTARTELQAYRDAPQLDVAQETVAVLETQTPESRCRLAKLSDADRAACTTLADARLALARARTKQRLVTALEQAENERDAAPVPTPPDARFALLGQYSALLPVIVLQLGSLLGLFAATLPRMPEPKPVPSAPNPPARPLLRAPPRPVQPHVAAPALNPGRIHDPAPTLNLVAALTRGERPCPEGVALDKDGWVRGPQRKLASAAGIPLSRLNQELKDAARKGLIQLDTSEGTAVRLAN